MPKIMATVDVLSSSSSELTAGGTAAVSSVVVWSVVVGTASASSLGGDHGDARSGRVRLGIGVDPVDDLPRSSTSGRRGASARSPGAASSGIWKLSPNSSNPSAAIAGHTSR